MRTCIGKTRAGKTAVALAAIAAAAGVRGQVRQARAGTFDYVGTGGAAGNVNAPVTGTFNNANAWFQAAIPPAADTTTILNFGGSEHTAYTASNDIAATLIVNQVNLNSTATVTETIAGSPTTNKLQFAGTTPQVNQNGSGAFVFSTSVDLQAPLLVQGSGSGKITFGPATNTALVITGVASTQVTINLPNGAVLFDNSNAGWAGGIDLKAGTVTFKSQNGGGNGSVGTGTLLLEGGTFAVDVNGSSGKTITNAMTINGDVQFGVTGSANALTENGAIALGGAGTTRTITAVATTTTLGGVISGTGIGLTKAGAAQLTLANAASTFTGDVFINQGVLSAGTLATGGANSSIGAGNAVTLGTATTSGTLQYTGTAAVTSSRTFTVQAGGGTLDLAGDLTLTSATPLLSSTSGAFTKVSNGTLTLQAASTGYTGAITVTGGALVPATSASLGTAAVSVNGTNNAQVTLTGATTSLSFAVTGGGILAGDLAAFTGHSRGAADFNIAANSVLAESADGANAAVGNLGNAADLFFGLSGNVTDSVTIGTGTPFKGVSNDRVAARSWNGGTITANSDFSAQGFNGKGLTFNGVTVASSGAARNVTVAPGILLLNSASSNFGGIALFTVANGGTLQAQAQTALGGGGATTPVPVTVQAGGTIDPGSTSTTAGSGSLNAAVTLQAGGTLLLNDAGNLNGSGTITQVAGAITRVANASALGAQSPGTVAGSIVRIEADNILNLDANVNDAAIYVVAGANRTAANATANTLTLNQTSLTNGALTQDGANDRTLTSVITQTGTGTAGVPTPNTGMLIGANGGTIAASTAQTLTVTSNVQGTGTLTIGVTGSGIADGSNGATAVAKQGIVRFTGATGVVAVPAVNVVAGTLNQSSGGLAYNIGTGGTGTTTVSSGATYLQDTGTVGFTRLVLLSGSTGRFQSTGTGAGLNAGIGSLEGAGSAIIGPAAAGTQTGINFTVGSNNLNATFSGVLSQANLSANGAVIKTGTGVWTLTGANTYAGGTTINGGTLLANTPGPTNSATGTGSVTINSTGTLGGTGRVAGAVTANLGGLLSPGTSPGTLSIAGPVTFGTASSGAAPTLVAEITASGAPVAGTDNDLLALTGTGANGLLTLSNPDRLNVVALTAITTPTTYTIATFASVVPSTGGFDTVLVNGAASQSADNTQPNFVSVTYNTSNIQITVNNLAAVPEPASLGLLGLGAVGLLSRRRRRARGVRVHAGRG